jgi:thaumarchaeosortase
MNSGDQIIDSFRKLRIKACLSRLLSLSVLLPLFSAIPMALLYVWAPLTFQLDWKGRFPYLIFIWLVFLETFLSKHELAQLNFIRELKGKSVKFLLGLACLLVPTFLAVWEYTGGGSNTIISLGQLAGAPGAFAPLDWIFAFESMLFAVFFTLSVFLLGNRVGLRHFSISLFFIGAISTFFMVDAFFPSGVVWFFQLLVPPIVSVATFFFNILGYATSTSVFADGYLLGIANTGGRAMNLLVYWSCAGVNSMIIYSVVILLLLRNFKISSRKKILYTAIGAVGTFAANISRIVSIGIIGIQTGPNTATLFHEYYGELFFIAWIIIYLAAVFLFQFNFDSKPQGNIHDFQPFDRRKN